MVAASRRPAADGLSALFDVFVLAQAVQELLADAFAGAPLTPEEYAVYSQLFMNPRCTLSELAPALAAPLTTVSDWVRTLDQRGHITREVRPDDRRSVRARAHRGRARGPSGDQPAVRARATTRSSARSRSPSPSSAAMLQQAVRRRAGRPGTQRRRPRRGESAS